MSITGNEELINTIRKERTDGTFKNAKTINSIIKEIESTIIMAVLAVQEEEKLNKLWDYILEKNNKGERLDKDEIVMKAMEIGAEEN